MTRLLGLGHEYAIGVTVIEMAPGDTTVGSTPSSRQLPGSNPKTEIIPQVARLAFDLRGAAPGAISGLELSPDVYLRK